MSQIPTVSAPITDHVPNHCWAQMVTQTAPGPVDHSCPVCGRRWRVRMQIKAHKEEDIRVLAIERLRA